MKVVKNDMVDMQWDADGFIESKKEGLIAAVHDYKGAGVVFWEGKVYAYIDAYGEAFTLKEIVKEIKRAFKAKDMDFPDYYDEYAEIYDGSEFYEKPLQVLGITEYKDDILARLKDLSGYWHTVEQDM